MTAWLGLSTGNPGVVRVNSWALSKVIIYYFVIFKDVTQVVKKNACWMFVISKADFSCLLTDFSIILNINCSFVNRQWFTPNILTHLTLKYINIRILMIRNILWTNTNIVSFCSYYFYIKNWSHFIWKKKKDLMSDYLSSGVFCIYNFATQT